MGDVLKLGSRASVTATVFEVRKGERLARGIFRVAPPARARLGTLALWSKPDPEFNPIVERARKALAAFQPT